MSKEYEAPIEVEDTDVEYTDDQATTVGSDLTSVTSSVFQYVYENGRRYASDRTAAHYYLPNDELEQERLDLAHHGWNVGLKGELHLATLPKDKRIKVLDLGTGTGIWAIDFGDMYPQAEVIGSDISPIQPGWVPPNVKFEIDDYEEEWVHKKESFDFIHGRNIVGAVKDWPALIKQAYEALAPGGKFELQETHLNGTYSDDGTYEKSKLVPYVNALQEAGKAGGVRIDITPELGTLLEQAGFKVTCHKRRWPVGTWAKDPKMKEIGKCCSTVCIMGAEAYGLAAFTRVLGMKTDDAMKIIKDAVQAYGDNKVHTIYPVYIYVAEKP
ncbi:S-adenosyl-L-methionine-dependent methyltransferase [Ascobolus immersus RN42]|uniref:S-adenosyl-L-methionine-dependent methyltransferase n=1 Tax=Ascobolus immersus RN42 TaxID=1160509 RepID=A0A3N4HQZ4_ASCIM|nr:S-adenosyl-L-methionine-dependent methyltransferase [Ascobolus immersus RN42]